jgi:dihydrofolate synthase/folylpolyglutamate synthase
MDRDDPRETRLVMFGLSKFGAGIGLHRILRYCESYGIDLPYLSSVSIVITGSKGKGSTTRFTYSMMRSILPETGCFISPHLFDIRERYEFAGKQIEPSVLAKHRDDILDYAAILALEGDSLGEFELLFLIALAWFNDVRPGCIVWEAGIGGRYDPVRALNAEFSALTSVELEHTELLGTSLELIAYDKLDAVSPGGCNVVSAAVSADLYPRLRAFSAIAKKETRFLAEEVKIASIETSVSGTSYSFSDTSGTVREVSLSLIGRHQVHNSLTALAVARAFADRKALTYSEDQFFKALRSTTWPGRLERISLSPDIWIDVGHTPESVRAVCDEILQLYDSADVLAIFGVSYNKSIDEIVAIVEQRFHRIVLTRANKNGLGVQRLQEHFRKPHKISACYDDVAGAVAAARSIADARAVIVVGGLFLAAEFAFAWRGGNPKDLTFF